jgi:hypothetical protein
MKILQRFAALAAALTVTFASQAALAGTAAPIKPRNVVVAVPTVHAHPSGKLILVPPTDLPATARQTGESMLLYGTPDDKTHLYIEHSQGAGLSIFDVTDPSHIKDEGSVQLTARGPFDFVLSLGEQAELVRFRRDQGYAVLDLHKVKGPALKEVQGLTLKGPTTALGGDGVIVTSPADADGQPIRDYQVLDTTNAQEGNRVFDVKGVREEITKNDTGTTFLLAEGGLYVVRRPATRATCLYRAKAAVGFRTPSCTSASNVFADRRCRRSNDAEVRGCSYPAVNVGHQLREHELRSFLKGAFSLGVPERVPLPRASPKLSTWVGFRS